MSAGGTTAWDQLPLGVQQRILLLTGHPSARRVSKAWRDTFDATNDTLSFKRSLYYDQSLKMAATAAATQVVRNSASLTAVDYDGQGYGTSLPLMLSDLLAAGAASGLATRLRKLAGVQIVANCAVQQLQVLRQCTGLTHLSINANGLYGLKRKQSHRAAVELTAAIQGMRSLTCLHIYDWNLHLKSVVAALASALQPLTQLQHLHVVFSSLGAAGAAALAPALSAMPGLQTLDVSRNILIEVEGAQALCTLLGAVPGLTHLNVCDCNLWDEDAALLAPVLRGMTCLQTLNMSYTRIGDGGMAILAPALAALPCLHTLNLSGNHLRDIAVSGLEHVLAKEGSPLQHLDLSSNRFNLDGAHALAAGLSPATQLQRLSLRCTDWNQEGWAAVAPALSRLAPSLQSLELGYERLDAVASALAPALQQLTGLTCLQAGGAFSSAAIATISPALTGMRRLQVLEFTTWHAPTEGAAAFATALPTLADSLTHLDLSYHNISAEAAANILAPALAQATGLVKLRLGGNGFGPQAAQWLVPVLSGLPHLREVGLSACNLGLQGCMAVVRALKDRDGTLVDLGANGVTDGSTEGKQLCNMAGITVFL